jgi:hypothetical protein
MSRMHARRTTARGYADSYGADDELFDTIGNPLLHCASDSAPLGTRASFLVRSARFDAAFLAAA